MMFSPFRIGVFIIGVTAALIGFDFYLYFDSVKGNTYSELIRDWGIQYRALPYLLAAGFGALLTHWFAKRDRHGRMDRRKKLVVLAFLTIATAIGGFLGFYW